MEITETMYAANREEWRAWLEHNYDSKSEIWLISWHKDTGRQGVSYSAAVEEALCFGWIDGIVKRFDSDRSAQRYTPRRPGSSFSQLNKERLERLRAAGQVIPSVLESTADVRAADYVLPEDVVAALKLDPAAWEFFSSTAPSYQRIRAAYVEIGRRDPEQFDKRLRNLIAKSAAGKQFGYGIEEYY